jgi:hypothetical protein
LNEVKSRSRRGSLYTIHFTLYIGENMKTEQPLLITSVTAAANLNKHFFIGFSGNLCAANAKALGVSNADTDSGEQLPVATHGIALVTSGAAVSQGAKVASNGSGKAVTYSTGEPNGYAIDAALGGDELIRILLT